MASVHPVHLSNPLNIARNGDGCHTTRNGDNVHDGAQDDGMCQLDRGWVKRDVLERKGMTDGSFVFG